MRRRVTFGSLAVMAGLAVTLAARPAAACRGQITCLEPRIVPRSAAPANLPAVAFWPRRDLYGPPPTGPVTFTRVAGDTREDVPFTTRTSALGDPLLVPTTPLAPMTEYEVTGPPACQEGTPNPPLRFRTGPEAPLPTSLGTVGISAVQRGFQHLRISGWGSDCGPNFAIAFLEARLELPPDAERWSGALLWTPTLDRQPWSIDSVFGTVTTLSGFAVTRFYVQCDGPDSGQYNGGPRPGRHRIGYRAHVPGQDTELTVEREVEMLCGDGVPTRSDAGVVAVTDLGAATEQDATTASGAMLREGGIGCSVGGGSARPGALQVSLAALLGLVVARRRRVTAAGRSPRSRRPHR